jgi:predicted SAM-dependent methyltransferase
MENNPTIGIIGGVYCSKSDPPAPLVFRGNGTGSYWDWKVGEFFEVTGLGMDCTLVRTSIFRQLSEPWYKTTKSDQFENGINKADEWTEDLYFLNRVSTETDFKIYCDATILCDHEDAYSGKKWNLPAYSLPTRKAAFADNEPRIVDIGCGEFKRDFNGIKPIRVDIREECAPDYRCDVRNLPFADGSFDIVFSSHVLEHFDRMSWKSVLAEWTRLVATNGKLVLVLPNIMWAAQRMVNDKIIDNDVLNVLYGAQSNPFDYHYNGLTPERVAEGLESLGFEIKKTEHQYYNMSIEATRRESKGQELVPVIDSVPVKRRKRK